MKEIIKSLLKQTRTKYILAVTILIAFVLILNFTFAMFSSRKTSELANIKVGKMNYQMKINTTETTKITAAANSLTIAEVSITSLNKSASAYELYYEICDGNNCEKKTINDFKVEYSSETASPVKGTINKDETKIIRIALTNDTANSITISFNINAGYTHNQLALLNIITNEYTEADLVIAMNLNGAPTNNFPAKGNYNVEVICNNGTGEWDYTNWKLIINSINGVAKCTINFNITLANAIIASYGGAAAITELPVSAFSSVETGAGKMYKTPDDYGTSYYFRGDHNLPNNVIFGGYQWKIIRIDSRGNVRMIYNGKCTLSGNTCTEGIYGNTAAANTSLTTMAFNPTYNDNKYVGYVYDTNTPSPIKGNASTTNTVDWFYNGLSAAAKAKIATVEYCRDRGIANADTHTALLGTAVGTGIGTSVTAYKAGERLWRGKTPDLRCANSADRLSLSAALVTADEVSFAGSIYGTANNNYYLRTNQNYWTMSPFYFNTSGFARVFNVDTSGNLNYNNVNWTSPGVRPVLALSSGTAFKSGNGSLSTPYIIE